MTSRRSLPRPSSGSRAAAFAAVALVGLAAVGPTLARGDDAGAPAALVERRDGVEIDWSAGTLTASGGAAADLRMPSADVARAGAVRRAEAAARARLEGALGALPGGGGRKLDAALVTRALARARVTDTDYQSNGGALVRVTARFVDWLEPPPATRRPSSCSPCPPCTSARRRSRSSADARAAARRRRLPPGRAARRHQGGDREGRSRRSPRHRAEARPGRREARGGRRRDLRWEGAEVNGRRALARSPRGGARCRRRGARARPRGDGARGGAARERARRAAGPAHRLGPVRGGRGQRRGRARARAR